MQKRQKSTKKGFWISQNCLGVPGISQNFLEFLRIFQYFPGISKICQDFLGAKCLNVLEFLGLSSIVQGFLGFPRISQNFSNESLYLPVIVGKKFPRLVIFAFEVKKVKRKIKISSFILKLIIQCVSKCYTHF